MLINRLLIFSTIGFILISCIPNKKVVYFQSNENTRVFYDSLIQAKLPSYELQYGDLLNIEVRATEPSVTEIFKSEANRNNPGQLANNASDINFMTGYEVDQDGNLNLPLVGKINVIGQTLDEAKLTVTNSIEKYITNPYVNIRLGGIRYTTFGEFNRPGRYSVLQSKLTLFEAIANAGDLTILANRKELFLIRQYPEGQIIHRVDVTDRDIVTSPFYYIKPNDQIYAEPLKVRELGAGIGVTGFGTFTSILSAISSALLLIVTINRL